MMTTVLIVDDEPAIRELLRDTLVLGGYDVLEAGCGAEACAAMADELPACVVLDVMMPDMSGYDVLAAWREDARTQALPVVMLTARADDVSTWRGWQCGADVYLPKPFDPAHLLDWVDRLTGAGAADDDAVLAVVPVRREGSGDLRRTALHELRGLLTDAVA